MVKNNLTLKQIELLMRAVVREESGNIFELKLAEQFKNYPTKLELFKRLDEIKTELQTSRDEQTIMNGQITNHDERIENIEEKLSIQVE